MRRWKSCGQHLTPDKVENEDQRDKNTAHMQLEAVLQDYCLVGPT